MIIQNEKQLEDLKVAGAHLREVIEYASTFVAPGVSTYLLEQKALEKIEEFGDKPSFLGFKPEGAKTPFPTALCVSINDEMVHGIPEEGRNLKDGDIVTIDCGLIHNGIFVDSAKTYPVGKIDGRAERLISVCKRALEYGICRAVAGNTTGDIGFAIETHIRENGFQTPPELGGHGVGGGVHEEPFVLNVGNEGEGDLLVNGLVIAIEPIVIEGKLPTIQLLPNGHTYSTADGTRASHFEHTLLVTKDKPIIVT